MKTYQDLIEAARGGKLPEFIIAAINDHKAGEDYRTAVDAEEYSKQRNVTITRYRKLLYDLQGNAVPDNWTANHKCASNFFNRFVTQQASYLLGNGATFEDTAVKDKLGKNFDTSLRKAGKSALIQGVCFGFYNLDRVQIFKLTEFVPLYDEENGSLRAGIRFWQIDDTKPLRATLYEEDGYTDFIKSKGESELQERTEKRAYKQKVVYTAADGEEIFDGENYPAFPIVPLWANDAHQSELVGLRENIDCYDLIKSGFANDLDDASMIYWTLENAGGMTDLDLAKFIERMKTIRAAVVDGDDGARATAHTLDVPYQSRETYLKLLRDDMYDDAMALNTAQISAGNITATQIESAYEPLNAKTDEFEMHVLDFIEGILAVAGIEDQTVTFTRSQIVNREEEITILTAAGDYLDDEYITERILTILGDGDKFDEIQQRKIENEVTRFDGDNGESKNENEEGADEI